MKEKKEQRKGEKKEKKSELRTHDKTKKDCKEQ